MVASHENTNKSSDGGMTTLLMCSRPLSIMYTVKYVYLGAQCCQVAWCNTGAMSGHCSHTAPGAAAVPVHDGGAYADWMLNDEDRCRSAEHASTFEVLLLLLAAPEVAVEPHDGQIQPGAHILSSLKQPHEMVAKGVLNPGSSVACGEVNCSKCM